MCQLHISEIPVYVFQEGNCRNNIHCDCYYPASNGKSITLTTQASKLKHNKDFHIIA